MIKGIEKLTAAQKELMQEVNELHTQCVGSDYKEGMKIVKVWIDSNNCICVRLANGEWYHYTERKEWY